MERSFYQLNASASSFAVFSLSFIRCHWAWAVCMGVTSIHLSSIKLHSNSIGFPVYCISNIFFTISSQFGTEQRAKSKRNRMEISFQSLVPMSISLATYCIHFISMLLYCVLVLYAHTKELTLSFKRHFSPILSPSSFLNKIKISLLQSLSDVFLSTFAFKLWAMSVYVHMYFCCVSVFLFVFQFYIY